MKDGSDRKLEHEVRNLQAEKAALENMLGDAADRLEQIAMSDCEDEETEQAKAAAKRYRRVIR